jgi:PAS domain S-box-containing protein
MPLEDTLIILDEVGTILWVNQDVPRLFDDLEEILAGSLNPSGRLAEGLRATATGGFQEASGEFRVEGRGDVRWKIWLIPWAGRHPQFLLSISLVMPANGETGNSNYWEVFEHAVEGNFRVTVEGRFLEINPAFARIFGYASREHLMAAIGNMHDELYVDPSRGGEFVEVMLKQGSVAGFQAEMNGASGRLIWVSIFARTVVGPDGCAQYFEGSIFDITESKQTEGALRRSEERFRRLTENTRVIPFEFDRSSQAFTYIAPQAQVLFGEEFRRGLPLQGWSALVHPEDREKAARFAAIDGLGMEGEFQTEFRIMTSGREVWVKQILHGEGMAEGTGHVRGFLIDTTESKAFEHERERSRVQLRELAARNQMVREEERINMAREIHDELGQTLTLLKLDISWISNRIGRGSDENSSMMQGKIGSMEQLIHWTLQSVRRIVSSLRPPLLDECGLGEAMRFHLESFAKTVPFRFEFEGEWTAELPNSTATTIFRIFQEILTNVARHANASRVKVDLVEEASQLLLTVQDNGCGITQEKVTGTNVLPQTE